MTGTHIDAHGIVYSCSFVSSDLRPYGYAEGTSIFDLIFNVAEPITYEIAGHTSAQFGDVVALTLSLLGDPALLERGGNAIFDLTGVLEPGTYQFTALAHAISEGNELTGDTGEARFDFTMDFIATVPETGATLGLLALAFAGLLGLRRALLPA